MKFILKNYYNIEKYENESENIRNSNLSLKKLKTNILLSEIINKLNNHKYLLILNLKSNLKNDSVIDALITDNDKELHSKLINTFDCDQPLKTCYRNGY